MSHAMEQLYEICDRLIWIDEGRIRADGDVRQTAAAYLEEMQKKQ